MRTEKIPVCKEYLWRAMNQLEAQPHRSRNLETIAEKVGVSYSTLGHDFSNLLEGTLVRFRSEARIKAAKELLESTNDPVKRIAELVGFKSIQGFQKSFKKITGITPGQYRAKAIA